MPEIFEDQRKPQKPWKFSEKFMISNYHEEWNLLHKNIFLPIPTIKLSE